MLLKKKNNTLLLDSKIFEYKLTLINITDPN